MTIPERVSAPGPVPLGQPAFDLGRLGDALGEAGLGEYVGCFDPFRPRRGDWEEHRLRAPARLHPVIDLFLLGRTVDRRALSEPVRALLDPLDDLGLVARQGTTNVAMSGGLAVLPVFGRWLICQPPQADPRFYFGDDTVALMSRMAPRAGGRCLDLCAGPGALALHAAGVADQVVAVERSSEAARLARLNVRLNRLAHRIAVLDGDLYGPVAGVRFDTVVANPPMLPFPAGLAGPALGHGGADGLEVTRRILEGLADRLSPSGTAQIIGVGLSDGAVPLGIDTLRQACGGRLDLTLSVLSHRAIGEGTPYLDALVATVTAGAGAETPRIRAAYLDLLGQARATALCHLFVHARHGRGEVEVIDVSQANRETGWRWRS